MIVLIDGFSIAFRAFYALPETLMTSKGTPTNVIHGFLSMLNKISTDYKLEQLIVTWDLPGKHLEMISIQITKLTDHLHPTISMYRFRYCMNY